MRMRGKVRLYHLEMLRQEISAHLEIKCQEGEQSQ